MDDNRRNDDRKDIGSIATGRGYWAAVATAGLLQQATQLGDQIKLLMPSA